MQSALVRVAERWHRIEHPHAAESYAGTTIYRQQVTRWRLLSWRRERLTDVVPDLFLVPLKTLPEADLTL